MSSTQTLILTTPYYQESIFARWIEVCTYLAAYDVHHVLFLHSFFPSARKEELGISSFGVSVTTMEEVFMKVGEGTEMTLETR